MKHVATAAILIICLVSDATTSQKKKTTKTNVVLRIVATGDEYWTKRNPPSLLQITSGGGFLTSEGLPLKKEDLAVYFQTPDKNGESFLAVSFGSNESTTFAEFIGRMNTLYSVIPKGAKATIFLQVDGLIRPK